MFIYKKEIKNRNTIIILFLYDSEFHREPVVLLFSSLFLYLGEIESSIFIISTTASLGI